jgi:hypothetical protein
MSLDDRNALAARKFADTGRAGFKVPQELITAGWALKCPPGIDRKIRLDCGDPPTGRSQLEGYKQIGVEWIDPSSWGKYHREGRRMARMRPTSFAKPRDEDRNMAEHFIAKTNAFLRYESKVPRMAAAIAALKGCRYPLGERGPGFKFCNAKRIDGSSYCQAHHELCHNNSKRGLNDERT